MDLNALCPECGKMIYANPNSEAMNCPECEKPIYIPRAIIAFEERFPTKGVEDYERPRTVAPPVRGQASAVSADSEANAPSPISEFRLSPDGTLVKYLGKGGEVFIPQGITGIEAGAFSGCDGVTRAVIPEGVKRIGSGAFSGCTALVSVIIPSSVTRIDGWTFFDCKSLNDVVIHGELRSIGGFAFAQCDSLKRIRVPEGAVIAPDAFEPSTEIVTSVILPPCAIPTPEFDITPNGALWAYLGKGGDVVIPDGVSLIQDKAFKENLALTSVVIPEGVTKIGKDAFRGCKALRTAVIPSSVKFIDEGAFAECESLVSAPLPVGLTSIPDVLFASCVKLSDIVIPRGVTEIGIWAFFGCASLRSITVPESVKNLGGWAFYRCEGLESVTFEAPKGWRSDDYFFKLNFKNPKKNAKLLCCSSSKFTRK